MSWMEGGSSLPFLARLARPTQPAVKDRVDFNVISSYILRDSHSCAVLKSVMDFSQSVSEYRMFTSGQQYFETNYICRASTSPAHK